MLQTILRLTTVWSLGLRYNSEGTKVELKPDYCLDFESKVSQKCSKGSLEKTDRLKELLGDMIKYVSF